MSPDRHANQSAVAYLLGVMLGVLLLGRRRWPLVVAVASGVILQLYYLLHYPGIFPAVPLSVALATAWVAGHPYRTGDVVTYHGARYSCLQSHTSLAGWEPPNTPALWKQG